MEDLGAVWNLRLEHYLKTGKESIHWAGIFINIAIILSLVIIIAVFMKRGLNKDLMKFLKNKRESNKRR